MTVYAKKEEIVVQKEEKMKDGKDNQAIETTTVLTFLSITLISGASKTLALEKICISGYYWQHSCSFLRTQNSWNRFHDGLIYDNYTAHSTWWTAVQAMLSCLVLAFLGSWSDKTGRRKVILMIPVIGVFLQIINSFINTIFFYELPFQFFFFFDAFFGSVVGYSVVFFGFFIYIYDETAAENKVYRLASILLCALTGVSLGMVLSRILLQYTCYYALYGLAFVTNIINRYRINKKLEDPIRTDEQKMYDDQNFKEFLRTFFDCSAIKDTARAVNKKEQNKRNVYMYIYVATMFVLFISVFGERSVFDLIARFNYSWDSTKISVFNFYDVITSILGVWIAALVISKKFGYHDAVIGIISCLSKIVSAFIFAFGSPDDIYYLGRIFGMLNGTGLLAIVFMITKMLEQNEIGKIASFVGIIECIARLLYVPLYYFMYTNMGNSTDVYLVGAGITVPALIVFIWILWKEKREKAIQTTTEDTALDI